jgi:hypothetical protein
VLEIQPSRTGREWTQLYWAVCIKEYGCGRVRRAKAEHDDLRLRDDLRHATTLYDEAGSHIRAKKQKQR